MNFKKLAPCFCILVLLSINATAQKKLPNSLLWRITGKGLTKPSYLFGTMHLKDRRLFQFGDSVYKNIETTAGFAMEIDPNEMLDSVLSNYSKADTTSLLRKALDKKKYAAVAKKLEKKTGVAADKITRKMLVDLRDNWAFKVKKKDDMNAAVDMYLFDIARRQGKWTGGIEDVSDQLNLGDELGRTIDLEKLVDEDDESEKEKMSYLEKMIGIYVKNDLQSLDEMVNGYSTSYRDILLLKRNVKMAFRMDSLANVRNTFFAVGAAHLAGDSGVIELLRKKGFAVEPVYSSQKIAPESYVFSEVVIPWITYAGIDSAYTASLPGKPTDMVVPGNILTLKVYADLSKSLVYINGFSFLAEDEKPESSYKRMISYFTGEQAKPETKDIKLDGLEGKEIISVKDNFFYKIQVFIGAQKLYIVMVGAEKKELLNSKDADRYLASFKPNLTQVPKRQQWLKQSLSNYAFEIEFPGKPSVDHLKPGDLPEGIEGTTYTMLQQPPSHYFMAVVSQTQKGFYIESDTVILNAKLRYYQAAKSKIEDLRYFSYDGFPAVSFAASVNNDGFDGVVKLMVVSRGNRNYTLAVVSEKGKENYPEVTQFFRQFKLLPEKSVSWNTYGSESNLFSTYAPSAFELKAPDSAAVIKAGVKKQPRFITFDSGLIATWFINVDAANPYQWFDNDSSFLVQQVKQWYSDTADYFAKNHRGEFDSLVSKRTVTNGKTKGIEIVTKNGSQSYYKQVRILPHGDSVYTLVAQLPLNMINSENNQRLFNDFRFADDNMPTSLFTDKTELILKDIQSSDSATRAAAINALTSASFGIKNLPLLHKAYLLPYAEDPDSYRTVDERLADVISEIKDSSTVAFIKENYNNTDTITVSRRAGMLDLLARQKTSSSYELLKHLLLTARPKKMIGSQLFYHLEDSVLLTRQLFPDAAVLFGDSSFGPGLIAAAVTLMDSGLIDKALFTSHAASILSTAAMQLKMLKKDQDSYLPFEDDVMKALGIINSAESVSRLNGYLKSTDLTRKLSSASVLVSINQQVPPLEVTKLAASVGQRLEFYQAFKKAGRQNAFPALYRTQQKFAESYLYEYANDEEELPMKLTFIKEKTAVLDGKLQRFFVFKASTQDEESVTNYAAFCGPFAIDKSLPEVIKDDADMQIMYDQKFVITQLDKQFQQYLQGIIDEHKKLEERQ